MSRGNDGMPLFESNEEFIEFLGILADVKAKTGFLVLAYCLMTNHFHFLMAIAQVSLASIMHQVLSRYAHRFNWRRNRRGHVFENRYKAKICVDDRYYRNVLPYIHRNPVKAGLVEDPADWEWSSHRQFIRPPRSALLDSDRALAYLDAVPESAMRQYGLLMQGTSDWEPEYDEPDPVPAAPLGPLARPTLEEIAFITRSEMGREFLGLGGNSRSPELSRVRRRFSKRAIEQGYMQSEIARYMGLSPSSVCDMLRAPG